MLYFCIKQFKADEVKIIRRRYISFSLPPKAKEVIFKILNEIYPANKFFRLRFNFDVIKCESASECLEHMLFHCESVQLLEWHTGLVTAHRDSAVIIDRENSQIWYFC